MDDRSLQSLDVPRMSSPRHLRIRGSPPLSRDRHQKVGLVLILSPASIGSIARKLRTARSSSTASSQGSDPALVLNFDSAASVAECTFFVLYMVQSMHILIPRQNIALVRRGEMEHVSARQNSSDVATC